MVLPERSQFDSRPANMRGVLHELEHATGHPSRLNWPALVNDGGCESETSAREALRAEILVMMTGVQLGVGRHAGCRLHSENVRALDPRKRVARIDHHRRLPGDFSVIETGVIRDYHRAVDAGG